MRSKLRCIHWPSLPSTRLAVVGVAHLQEPRGECGGEGQGDHGRNQDGNAERHREFPHDHPDHPGKHQERDEGGDQRQGDGDDGEADLGGALHRRLQPAEPLLAEARNVLHHHDGIVDHEGDGDGERGQGDEIQAVVEEVHHDEGAGERHRDRHAGNQRRPRIAQEQQDRSDHQHGRRQEGELRIEQRAAYGDGAVGNDVDMDRGRQPAADLRQRLAHAVHGGDDIGAGLALDEDEHRRVAVQPAADAGIDHAVGHGSDIAEPHDGAIMLGDDQPREGGSIGELAVGDEGLRPIVIVEAARRQRDAASRTIAARTSSRPMPTEAIAAGFMRTRTAALAAPWTTTLPTPSSCASFSTMTPFTYLITSSGGSVSQRMERKTAGIRIGLIFLNTGRLGMSFGSSSPAALMAACTSTAAPSMLRSGANCRVIWVLPSVLIEVSSVTGGDAAEPTLERRGDGARHGLRAGAGQLRRDDDGRHVDRRQGGDRQLPVGGRADQHDADGDQHASDRPAGEEAREAGHLPIPPR